MVEVTVLTWLLGAVTAFASWRKYRSFATGAVVFWASWATLVTFAWGATASGFLPEWPSSVERFLTMAYAGAFAGGLIAIWITPGTRKGDRRDGEQLLVGARWTVSRFFAPFLVLILVTGVIHFVERWARIGYDPWRFYELRLMVLDEGWLWSSRIASYVSFLGFLLVVFFGALDAKEGIRPRRLAAVWLASVPHGLAFGGRGWTLGPLLVYTVSLLVSHRPFGRRVQLRKLTPVVALFALGLWFFVVLGLLRRPDASGYVELSPGAWKREDRMMLANWVGSSVIALGPASEYAAETTPALGEFTFEYFAAKAKDFGLSETEATEQWKSWVTKDLPRDPVVGFTWCVPPTAIPFLILDYGEYGMIVAMAVLVAGLHWVATRYVARGILGHVAALLAFNALFSTIQTLALFTAGTIVPIAFAAGLELFLRRPVVRTKVLRKFATREVPGAH